MSFITAVVIDGFISVTTDGRAQKNGKTIDENAVKHLRPRHSLVIAYTGVKEACEEILKFSGISYQHDNLELIVAKISRQLQKDCYSQVKLSFIVAGDNSLGKNQLSTISNFDKSMNLVSKSGNDLKMAQAGSEELSKQKRIYEKALSQYKIDLSKIQSAQDILNAQKRLTSAVADFDQSVNKKIQYIYF